MGNFFTGSVIGGLSQPNGIEASGLWSLRAQRLYRSLNRWPSVLPSISNCIMWLDASNSATVTLNGSNVAAIADLAFGNTITQPVAARQPAYITSAKNGLNTIRFTSASTHFLNTTSVAAPASHTVFAVIQREAVSTRQFILGNRDNLLYSQLWNSTGDRNHQSNAASVAFGTNNTITGWFYITLRRDGTTSIRWRENGSTIATVTTGTGVTSAASTSYDVIARAGAFYTDGDIGEIIFYNKSLSDSEVTTVESYLASKWSI